MRNMTGAAGFLLAAVIFISSCATHVTTGYRAYDPVHRDYHVWGPSETTYYNQWTVETHRQKRDYKRLKPKDQDEYWKWRHDHPDHH